MIGRATTIGLGVFKRRLGVFQPTGLVWFVFEPAALIFHYYIEHYVVSADCDLRDVRYLECHCASDICHVSKPENNCWTFGVRTVPAIHQSDIYADFLLDCKMGALCSEWRFAFVPVRDHCQDSNGHN